MIELGMIRLVCPGDDRMIIFRQTYFIKNVDYFTKSFTESCMKIYKFPWSISYVKKEFSVCHKKTLMFPGNLNVKIKVSRKEVS